MSLYQIAQQNDPILAQARHQLSSSLEALPQARAKLFPELSATAVTNYANSTDPLLNSYNTNSYGLTLTQDLFNFSTIVEYQQADERIKAAVATFAAAEQAVIIRLVEQYLEILKAQDDLTFSIAERKAFSRQLEQIQGRFSVGLMSVTDVHEAKARRDSAYSDQIAAESALRNEKEAMREITGVEVTEIAGLKDKLDLQRPDPDNVEKWVAMALKTNLSIKARRSSLKVSKSNIKIRQAGHLPVLQIEGNVLHSRGAPPTSTKSLSRDIGLSIKIPIFSGGGTFSQVRQATFDYENLKSELEEATRVVENETRRSFRNVVTQINQVNALKQVVLSTKSALDATQASFEVGTRTIVDVLNAQSDVLRAERDYSKSRYDYVFETLKLKQSAGTLTNSDLQVVNKWFKGTSILAKQAPAKRPEQSKSKPNQSVQAKSAEKSPIHEAVMPELDAITAESNREPVAMEFQFALQLLGSRYEDKVKHFIAEHELIDIARCIKTTHKGKPWYVLMYGNYNTGRDAQKAIKSLPLTFQKLKPWPRKLSAIK